MRLKSPPASLIRTKQNNKRREMAVGEEVRSNFKALRQPSDFSGFRECVLFIMSYQHGFSSQHRSACESDDSLRSGGLSGPFPASAQDLINTQL